MRDPILLPDDTIFHFVDPPAPATTDITASPAQLRRALLYRGLITRVATKLGRHHSHVSRVARGIRTSKKITDALLAEIQQIERRAA